VPLDRVWVVANFKETVLAKMRIGQPVDVKADLYGSSVHYHGKVLGISPGTGSTFELLPPQNATGNWIKVVRRVPVRIGLRESELKQHPLRLGLSMSVSVDVRDTHGSILGEAPAGRTTSSTDVYQQVLQKADAQIDAIIRANSHGGAAPPNSQATHGS
jgi:membrane fusion protein (multidrug efflux system)